MLKMKKILGILLAFCFIMSVTAAAVSASAPGVPNGKNKYDNHINDGKNKYDNHINDGKNKYDNHINDGKNKYDNHINDGKNKYGNHYGKKKYQMKGHWGYKQVKHNKDKNHKSFWYSNERYWIPSYWYWK